MGKKFFDLKQERMIAREGRQRAAFANNSLKPTEEEPECSSISIEGNGLVEQQCLLQKSCLHVETYPDIALYYPLPNNQTIHTVQHTVETPRWLELMQK